jgi:hypothetical protein
MSYAFSPALQAAVYQALVADTALSTIVGPAVFDGPPDGEVPHLYVMLGPETARDASDKTSDGAVHLLTLSIVTDAPGFAEAKRAAAAICDALIGADLELTRGRLVSIQFDKATARRSARASGRRIDLRLRARVEAD